MATANLSCCCGQLDCAYLHHNNLALSDLERDVETAAQLGQALLDRHESYMAESEQERRNMTGTIENLSETKRNLETENARIVQENRDLLDQLEGLNNTISESDSHIKSLDATLVAAQLEVRRLSSLAARTADLEAQLAEMELGQARLQHELSISKEDERSAMQRWRHAQITLRNLNEQMERIEKEARDERERHVELLGRMERRRVVDSELKGAAGRLKGAAAAASLNRNSEGTNVVSHFVRDILQDNANLQAGIVELREMLQTSNDEVQTLREQIMLHQPLDDTSQTAGEALSEEIERSLPHHYSQQVHVHHHYHTPAGKKSAIRKERTPLHRGRRPRSSLTPLMTGGNTPVSESRSLSYGSVPTTTPSPYARTPPNRWSMQSAATGFSSAGLSALSSSPTSAYRTSSIFDRIEAEYDSSRPTSPESAGFASPRFARGHKKDMSEFSFTSLGDGGHGPRDVRRRRSIHAHETLLADADVEAKDTGGIAVHDISPGLDNDELYQDASVIPEETDRDNSSETSPPISDTDPSASGSPIFLPHPKLQRSTSHESLISISGMDIHTLKERPSQLFIGSRTLSSTSVSTPGVASTLASSTDPLTSTISAHASSSHLIMSRQELSSRKLLSGLAATPPSHAAFERAGTNGFSKLVGGWSWGKWGVAPTPSRPSTGISRPSSASTVTAASLPTVSISKPTAALSTTFLDTRNPGINQKGPVMGFRPPLRTPSAVHAKEVNQGLLRESLAE